MVTSSSGFNFNDSNEDPDGGGYNSYREPDRIRVVATCENGDAKSGDAQITNAEFTKFVATNDAEYERYCASGSNYTGVLDAHDNLVRIQTMREIYDATILTHIYLVGQPKDYSGENATEAYVAHYRSGALAGVDHPDPLDSWKLVRDETFRRFRDGTMEVFLPLEDGEVPEKYGFFTRNRCFPFGGIITVNHPTITRQYQKTTCFLGTVFEDQAFFLVQRKKSNYPELLNKPLTVDLACGYSDRKNPLKMTCISGTNTKETCRFNLYKVDPVTGKIVDFDPHTYNGCVPRVSQVGEYPVIDPVFILSDPARNNQPTCTFYTSDPRYSFAKNIWEDVKEPDGSTVPTIVDKPSRLKSYRIVLYPRQDAVLFPVPKPRRSFDYYPSSSPSESDIRCTIAGAVYGSNIEETSLEGDDLTAEDITFDPNKLTAIVEVSKHDEATGYTFHSKMTEIKKTANIPSFDERVAKIQSALFYTYVWGWYTGFIQMPYYSIQGLLSRLPFVFVGKDGATSAYMYMQHAAENQEMLHLYQILASLFVDESDDRFAAEHFGFLTPEDAMERYKETYGSRFEAYFGRALGGYLQNISSLYSR